MSKLDVRIRPATHQDLEACAICWGNRRDTYPSIYPLRLVKTSVTRGQRLARNTRDLEKMLNDSTNDFRVAIASDPASEVEGIVVGYSIWAKPEGFQRDYEAFAASTLSDLGASAPQDQIEGEPDPECNHELAAKLKEEGMRVKQRFSEGKRFW